MNTLELSKKICFKSLEDEAMNEYYNVQSIIIEGKIKRFSSMSLKYAVAFQYCFKKIEDEVLTDKRPFTEPGKKFDLIVLNYLFTYRKKLDLVKLTFQDYNVLFALSMYFYTFREYYKNEFKIIKKIMKYIMLEIINLTSKYNYYKFVFKETFYSIFEIYEKANDVKFFEEDFCKDFSILFNKLYQYDPTKQPS